MGLFQSPPFQSPPFQSGGEEVAAPSGYRRLMMHLALAEAFDEKKRENDKAGVVALIRSGEPKRKLRVAPVPKPAGEVRAPRTRQRSQREGIPTPLPVMDVAWASRFARWALGRATRVQDMLSSLPPLPPMPEVKEPEDDGLVWLLYAAAAA